MLSSVVRADCGGVTEDIARYAQDRVEAGVPFTREAIGELGQLWRSAHSTYRQSLQAFRDRDVELARLVCEAESEFDHRYWRAREMHIHRLKAGLCHPEADVIYTETLRLLERIGDHADNLGVSVARNSSHTPERVKVPLG